MIIKMCVAEMVLFQAYELSTLTGTQVMLLVASETGHVYTFATRFDRFSFTSSSTFIFPQKTSTDDYVRRGKSTDPGKIDFVWSLRCCQVDIFVENWRMISQKKSFAVFKLANWQTSLQFLPLNVWARPEKLLLLLRGAENCPKIRGRWAENIDMAASWTQIITERTLQICRLM